MSQIPEHLAASAALKYIVSKGWKWNPESGGQVQIETCPFCHKGDYKFYVAVMDPSQGNRDGLFFCHHGSCQTTGNLNDLKEAMGDKIAGVSSFRREETTKQDQLPDVDVCHAALLADAEAYDYLLNVRGFSAEIIESMKLGLKEKMYFHKAGEVKGLVIPYLVNGNVVFAKYRTLPPSPKDFTAPKGWEVPLYNGELLDQGPIELILVEGEADALSCMSHGILNVCGVPGAGLKKAAWIDAVDKLGDDVPKYLLYDNDKAGSKGAQELASRIGIDKVKRIVLPTFEVPDGEGKTKPGKDVNEWFLHGGGTLEKFQELKQEAELFDVTGVTSSKDALEQLEDELAGRKDLAPTYVSPWADLNALVGFEDGDVIDILAPEKVGKTTLGLNLIDHMASTYGEDGLVVCLEMTQARLARKWVSLVTGFEDLQTQPGTPESKAKLEELKGSIVKAREIQNGRGADIYFAYPQMVKTPEDVFKLIRDCIRRYGVKWVMFDNLQLLCDKTLGNQGHRTIHLSQISKGFATLAKDYRIKLIRILQPKRIEKGQIAKSGDTDGSSQVAKDCDCHITMWRNPENELRKSEWESQGIEVRPQSFSAKTLLNVELSRYSSGGTCAVYFDGARSQVRPYDSAQKSEAALNKQTFNQIIPVESGPVTVPTEAVAI